MAPTAPFLKINDFFVSPPIACRWGNPLIIFLPNACSFCAECQSGRSN
jgi:hypothetical protein